MNCIYCHQQCKRNGPWFTCDNHKSKITYTFYDKHYKGELVISFYINTDNILYLIYIDIYNIYCAYKFDISIRSIGGLAAYKSIIQSNTIIYISPETAEEFISKLILL